MSRLQFNPQGHHYLLDGKKITGVTTILNVIAKPALINWAANMAVDYIKMRFEKAGDTRSEFYENPLELDRLLEEARKAHCQKRDKAGDIGTETHKWIEEWIKTKGDIDIHPDTQVRKMCQNFINWAETNKVKFLASEKRVYSEKFWFAGTYDFLAEIDGKTYLGDIKTSSGIYPEMWAQCAGYQICEEEQNPELKIDGNIIVNLKKDGTIQTKTSFDYVGYKKMFLSALVIYRQLNEKQI